jgi:hypothetical protein
MSDFMLLWKSRVSAILGIVRAGETEHREVASMAAQVFYGPATQFGSSTFGKITTQANFPRIIQLGIRLEF